MLDKINLKNFVTQKQLKKIFQKLFKIPRSITGRGFEKSLKILGEIADINIIKIKSGTKVLDWTIPDVWNIKDAYLIDSSGKKLIDYLYESFIK